MAKKKATKKPEAKKKLTANQAYSIIMNTISTRREMLSSFLNPGKNIDYECGYPDSITKAEYAKMFRREGIGNRVVSLIPKESWNMPPEVYETEDSNETEFEKIWKELIKKFRVYHYLQRVDVLSGIVNFGLLLLGINDGLELSKPAVGINEKTGEKEGKVKHELIYLKPFSESNAKIKASEGNTASPRYGLPTMYTVNFESVEISGAAQDKDVHWTRVIHVADNRTVSEVLGAPRMEAVWNRLLDVRKVLAGSGEMFWRGGYPGLSFETDKDMEGDFTPAQITSLKAEMEDYTQGLQRYLAVAGVSVKSLQPQVSDPKSHIDAQVKMIAIALGCPYRIFTGTEEAKLAGSQDSKAWNKRIAKRQVDYNEPMLLRPFIDRLIAFGVLPEVEYIVDFPDLDAPSDEDKAKVALIKTEAFAKYVQASIDGLVPPKEYLMIIMGMAEEEAEAIIKAAEVWVDEHAEEEEAKRLEEEERVAEFEAQRATEQ